MSDNITERQPDSELNRLQAIINQQERDIRLLTYDSVTGLLKKEGFIFKVKQEDPDTTEIISGPFAILLLDFDDLKGVNDNYGYKFGDIYLERVAREIDRFAWEQGELIGVAFRSKEGDEFGVILELKPGTEGGDVTQEDYESRVKEFADLLNNELPVVGEDLVKAGIVDRSKPKVSIGSRFFKEGLGEMSPGERLTELFKEIDEGGASRALKVAKLESKSEGSTRLATVVFSENLTND